MTLDAKLSISIRIKLPYIVQTHVMLMLLFLSHGTLIYSVANNFVHDIKQQMMRKEVSVDTSSSHSSRIKVTVTFYPFCVVSMQHIPLRIAHAYICKSKYTY